MEVGCDGQDGVGEGGQTKFEKGQVGNIEAGLHKKGGLELSANYALWLHQI